MRRSKFLVDGNEYNILCTHGTKCNTETFSSLICNINAYAIEK